MSRELDGPWWATWRWTLLAVVSSLAFLACFVRIGADWDWLVAMGDHVRATREVPDGVPFASADTAGWRNVPLLAEVVASFLHDLGPRSAVIAHLVLVAVALVVLARAARDRGASDAYAAGAIAVLCVGSLSTLGVLRAQTFSLVPFALVVALVSRQARRPDRRIWWVVPLVAVWGNLHGAALLGVCVLGAYLLVHRARTRLVESVAVGAVSVLALCATPALWHTPAYYAQVFDNVSAERGEGLWAQPSIGMPFDVAMILAAAALVLVGLRSRRPAWEYVAVLGLCVATASAARHGVWLLVVLVVVAAGRPKVTDGAGEAPPTRGSARTAVMLAQAATVAVAMVVAVPIALARGEVVLGAPSSVVREVATVAQGGVVLAPAPLSESLAVAGVRVWVVNPLDAFSHADQAAYLDFLDGSAGARRAIAVSDLVVVREGSPQEALMADETGFAAQPCGDDWICFSRS